MEIGESCSESEVECTWIEVEFVVEPASPLPRRAIADHSTLLLIKKREFDVDLDRGGVIRHEWEPKESTVDLRLRMPKFGIDRTAMVHEDDPKKIVKSGAATEMRHTFVIHNEVPQVAEYMSAEMTKNVGDARLLKIKDLGTKRDEANAAARAEYGRAHRLSQSWRNILRVSGATTVGDAFTKQAIALTLEIKARFAMLVHTGGVWDHKPILGNMAGQWHTWGALEYFLDLWSNIHFGYVGRAAGLTREELAIGANLEQWFDDLGPDPAADTAAIGHGCDLFDSGTAPTPAKLIEIVESSMEFTSRARSYNSWESKKSIVPK